MVEHYGSCRACHKTRLLHTSRLLCIDCALAAFARDHGEPPKMQACVKCGNAVPRVFQKRWCLSCLMAAHDEEERAVAFDEVQRFFRDVIAFNTPLTLRDFARTWR